MSNFHKIYDRVIDKPPIFNTLSKFPKIFMSVNLSYIIVQLDNDYAYSFTFIHLIPCPELRGNAHKLKSKRYKAKYVVHYKK